MNVPGLGHIPTLPEILERLANALSAPVNPVGGTYTINNQIQVVARLEHPGGVQRKGLVLLTSPGRQPFPSSGNDYTGIAARITCTSARGGIRFWTGVPAAVPVEGTVITVEAILANVPYEFGYGNTGIAGTTKGILGPYPGVNNTTPSTTDPGLALTAQIIDAFADYPTEAILFEGTSSSSNGTVAAIGPLFVTAVKFANKGTANVQFVLMDRNGGSATTYPVVERVLSPAGSTIAINLNKPFYRGIVVFGCADWSAPAVHDANADSVDVSVYGTIFDTQ